MKDYRYGQPMYAAALAVSLILAALPAHAQRQQGELRFDFTSRPAPGAVAVKTDARGAVPLYSAATGYGFVNQTAALPARPVHTEGIEARDDGFTITEQTVEGPLGTNRYNHFGMAFRIKAAPGAYAVKVRTTSDAADTIVSVNGIYSPGLKQPRSWDAAGRLPNGTGVTARGRDWSYRYASGRDFIDIEIEPKKAGVPVGVAEIVLAPIPPQQRAAGERPTLFLLGDSMMMTYTFSAAPMSGWGQVIDDLFDPAKVTVANYAMGGRSARSAYAEGRLNDLLLTGRAGDVVMIQFGLNDEGGDEMDRFGTGATEEMFEEMIRQVYIPAARARGMLPVLVTPMSRVNGAQKPGTPYVNGFRKRRFPDVLRKVGAELGVPVVDLNARSVEYYNAAGVEAITAMVMSIEAGESPGRTNDANYANGHPANRIDSHAKEALAKQYARLVVTDLARLAAQGDKVAAGIVAQLRPEVRKAVAANDWSTVYPEIPNDMARGENAYYRNQVEKLLQLGALRKDAQGNFRPQEPMRTAEFIGALRKVMGLPATALAGHADGVLTREAMGALLRDAYHATFTAKPAYMTDNNGKTIRPGSPGYDPKLDSGAKGAMYYPLVPWAELQDTAAASPAYADKLRDAYELGLIRSEVNIARGRMVNGRLLEPQAQVTRAKAAKALYFMWVLAQPPKEENDRR